MKTPHKHAELIIAWANGAEIEVNDSYKWQEAKDPTWSDYFDYRIKPENDVVLHCHIDEHGIDMLSDRLSTGDNLKLTFDSKTGKLIKAEVI